MRDWCLSYTLPMCRPGTRAWPRSPRAHICWTENLSRHSVVCFTLHYQRHFLRYREYNAVRLTIKLLILKYFSSLPYYNRNLKRNYWGAHVLLGQQLRGKMSSLYPASRRPGELTPLPNQLVTPAAVPNFRVALIKRCQMSQHRGC